MKEGVLTKEGKELLAALLEKLPLVHNGKWGEVFVPLVSRLVRVCADIAVIKDHKVLLKYRRDEFFRGWEAPGGSLGPGESWEDAAKRFGKEEFGVEVKFINILGTFNNTDNPRAHDVTVLLHCELIGDEIPSDGRWFSDCPIDLIPVHRKYWPALIRYILPPLSSS